MNSIIFAAGCFWNVQSYFKSIKGVMQTKVGYTCGDKLFPTYEEVKNGNTGHTEACYILYNENVITLDEILNHYFSIVSSYKSLKFSLKHHKLGIYVFYDNQKILVDEQIKIKKEFPFVDVKLAGEFWDAEDYHQDYYDKKCDVLSDIKKSFLLNK
jgi:peptide-methionine (S)-S-oxide reductase